MNDFEPLLKLNEKQERDPWKYKPLPRSVRQSAQRKSRSYISVIDGKVKYGK